MKQGHHTKWAEPVKRVDPDNATLIADAKRIVQRAIERGIVRWDTPADTARKLRLACSSDGTKLKSARPWAVPQDMRAEMVRLRAEGMTLLEIGKRFDRNKSVVHKVIAEETAKGVVA